MRVNGENPLKKLAKINWLKINEVRREKIHEIAKLNDEMRLTGLMIRTMACSKGVISDDVNSDSETLTEDEKDAILNNVIESLKDYIVRHDIKIDATKQLIEAKLFSFLVCNDITYIVSTQFFDNEMYELDGIFFSMSDTVISAIKAMRTDWDEVLLFHLSSKDEAEILKHAVEHMKSDKVKLILKSDDFFDMKELENLSAKGMKV